LTPDQPDGPGRPAGYAKDLLLDYLGGPRRHVLGILEGLDEEAMRRPVLPSGWACRDLVHHLALDDERFWLRGVVGGDPEVIDQITHRPIDAWRPDPSLSAAAVLDLYRREIALADAALAAADLDAAPRWWPDFLGDRWMDTTGEVILHVVVETATHAGHLDAVRELVDGRQWMVLGD
jgi:uncharacterized damage-inducible protein DinB